MRIIKLRLENLLKVLVVVDFLGDVSDADLMRDFNVSRESLDRLYIYRDLLVKWQKAINLVSNKSLPDAWRRHFLDSVQLLPQISGGVRIIADLGSGGGFPGAVLAVLRDDFEVHLVDSDYRKCQFLKNVSRETFCSFEVHNERVESVLDTLNPDLITARGFAPLVDLFGYCGAAIDRNPALNFLLLKGRNALQEIELAQTKYSFDYTSIPSLTDAESHVLMISDVRRIESE